MTSIDSGAIAKNYLHAVWRLPVLLVWMVSMPLFFLLLRTLKLSSYQKVPHIFHQGVSFILGLNVFSSGTLCKDKPTFYVSNHISYLDIFVLGSIPGFFVAKSEVAAWPVFGQLARFQNTIFIERKSGKTKQTLLLLQGYLRHAKSLILFPEGTSTDGTYVKRFKSSLFEAVVVAPELNPIPIQAITVAYTQQGGRKMNQAMRDHYAWYATMPFLGHFAKLFVLKNVDVNIHFHPVCYLEEFETRKECAEYCQTKIANKLAEFIA